jgi:hypothetical protein
VEDFFIARARRASRADLTLSRTLALSPSFDPLAQVCRGPQLQVIEAGHSAPHPAFAKPSRDPSAALVLAVGTWRAIRPFRLERIPIISIGMRSGFRIFAHVVVGRRLAPSDQVRGQALYRDFFRGFSRDMTWAKARDTNNDE